MRSPKSKLLKEVIKQKGKYAKHELAFFVRMWFVFKVIICILFGWHHHYNTEDEIVRGLAKYDKHGVRWHPDPAVYQWTELAVGKNKWFYHEVFDMTPEGAIEGDYNV